MGSTLDANKTTSKEPDNPVQISATSGKLVLSAGSKGWVYRIDGKTKDAPLNSPYNIVVTDAGDTFDVSVRNESGSDVELRISNGDESFTHTYASAPPGRIIDGSHMLYNLTSSDEFAIYSVTAPADMSKYPDPTFYVTRRRPKK